MSGDASKPDLSQLAVERNPPAKVAVRNHRRWLARYALPACILLGFASLFVWAARDSFLPAQPITITPVVVNRAEVKQAGTPLFQAAGWVEPRPTPVVASSLAPGVIQEVLVIEGQEVALDQPVATLIAIDAKLALAEAQAEHKLQQAEVSRAEAALVAAKTNLAKPVSLRAALADAEAILAETQLVMGNLPYALEAARTKKQLAEDDVERKELAGDAITGRLLRESRAELANATSLVNELVAREPTLQRQIESLQERRDALAEKLELLTDERRAVAEAEANLQVAQAKTEQTRLAVETAELRLERMTVRAPIAGRVLSLEARPGQRLSGINPHSEQGSSAVASLYDPSSLQVRVDVRLEDVPQVLIGQPTLIETPALSGSIEGEVISVTTLADIQKNTLQVKVAVNEPPAVLKPEMLGKVTFLAPASPVAEGEQAEMPLRLFIPRALVAQSEGGASVWVADLTAGIARRRKVELGLGVTEDGLIEITRGLQPTDKLIVTGRGLVVEGMRVQITGEDRGSASGLLSSPSQTAQKDGSER